MGKHGIILIFGITLPKAQISGIWYITIYYIGIQKTTNLLNKLFFGRKWENSKFAKLLEMLQKSLSRAARAGP